MSIELEAEVRFPERVWVTADEEVMLECDNIDVVVYYSSKEKELLSPGDSMHLITKFPRLQEELEQKILEKAKKEKEKWGKLYE